MTRKYRCRNPSQVLTNMRVQCIWNLLRWEIYMLNKVQIQKKDCLIHSSLQFMKNLHFMKIRFSLEATYRGNFYHWLAVPTHFAIIFLPFSTIDPSITQSQGFYNKFSAPIKWIYLIPHSFNQSKFLSFNI